MRITVDVKADSRDESVEDLGNGRYLVRVKAPRRKGKANAEVLKLLRRYFGCRVSMLRGHTSTRKILDVEREASTKRGVEESE
jgi:uncharacterized protein (TIGR00251 family)